MLNPNATVEQFVYTAGGAAALGPVRANNFGIWSCSSGLEVGNSTSDDYKFWNNIREVILRGNPAEFEGKSSTVNEKVPVAGAKPIKFGKNKGGYHERDLETVTRQVPIYGKITVLEQNFTGKASEHFGTEHHDDDFRKTPEKAPYRLVAVEMPDGRLAVMRYTFVNIVFGSNGRTGNFVAHAFIFPKGTKVEDIRGLDLPFRTTIPEQYYIADANGNYVAPPKSLPTVTAGSFKKKGATTQRAPQNSNFTAGTQAGQTAQRQPAQKQPAQRQATQQPQQKPAQQTTQQKPAQTTAQSRQPQQNAQQTASQPKQPQQTAQQKQPVQPKPAQQKPVGQTAQQQKPAAQKPVQTTAQPQKPAQQKPSQQQPAQQTAQPKPANIPPYTFDQLLQECAMRIVNYQSRLSSTTGTRKKELEEEIVKNLDIMRARVAKLGNDALAVWASAAENNMQIALLNVEENCNRTKKPFVHSEATNDPNYKAAASLARIIHSERVKRGLIKTDSNTNTNSNTKK